MQSKLKKISPSTGILFKGVLIPTPLTIPLVSCFFTNLDFLLPQIVHFYDKTNLPFLVCIIFATLFSVIFLQTKQYVNMFVL